MTHVAETPIARLGRYAGSADPLLRAANLVALVLAGNQPFYPLYVLAEVGPDGWPAWAVLPSVPFFLAVPALCRRNARLGRALLALTGTANTLICIRLLGEATGVGLLLIPSIGLSAVLFRRSERRLALALSGLPMLGWYLLHDRAFLPLQPLSPEQYRHLLTLNAMSTGTLTAFLGFVFAAAHAEDGARQTNPTDPPMADPGAAPERPAQNG